MGRYTEANCKICRRNGGKLFLKGDRCLTAKCAFEKRKYAPGIAGNNIRRKISKYGRRLKEKQKLRFFYGVSESVISNYFKKADKQKGVTGNNLLFHFEKRLDNIIYRASMASSRKAARQLVMHGHFKLNSRKANIPSIILKEGDEITIKDKSLKLLTPKLNVLKEKGLPAWLAYDEKNKNIKMINSPKREEIDVPVKEQLVVEYYSR